MRDHDDRSVKPYLGKVKSLGAQALRGKSVREEVARVITEAVEHLKIIPAGTQLGNLQRFLAFLIFAADTTPSSQHEMRSTFEYAARLVDQAIHNHEEKSA
jgi:hypothetical protein